MLWTWFRKRARQRFRDEPFPAEWFEFLDHNVWHYGCLEPAEQETLRFDLRVLLAEKSWEGCGGLVLTDEVRVTIAAQAALLLLHRKHNYYSRTRSILVYPDTYVVPAVPNAAGGSFLVGRQVREGEAWYRGPVILNWRESLAGSQHRAGGHNLVLHEFAHQLDMEDGVVDGTPPLPKGAYDRWRSVMTAEFEALVRDAQHGRPTLLDPYGTTNPGEFFAVATECFFERSAPLRELHPQLFGVLAGCYGYELASRRNLRGGTGYIFDTP